MPSSFLPGQDPKPETLPVWAKAYLTASETGVHSSPRSSPGLTQVMEWKLRPGLLWKKHLERPSCLPPNPRGPRWTPLSFTVGTCPPAAPPPGLRVIGSVAAAPWSFTGPSRTSGHRTTPFEALQGGGAMAAGTKQGKDLDLPPAAAIGEPPGPPSYLCCLYWAFRHTCLCLPPASGLTALDSLIPWQTPMAPVSGESWSESASVWTEVCTGPVAHTCLHSKTLVCGLKAGPHRAMSVENARPFLPLPSNCPRPLTCWLTAARVWCPSCL